MKPPMLNAIMSKHGSSKGNSHPPKHNYAFLYDRWLASHCAESIRLLEIGGSHQTMSAWAEYFPRGKVVSFGRDGEYIPPANSRIWRFTGQPTSPTDLKRFNRAERQPFHVIIDSDATQPTAKRVATFVSLFQRLMPGGLIAIESCDQQTVAAFDSLRVDGVLLPPLDSPVSMDQCVSLSENHMGCFHSHVPGSDEPATNNLIAVYRKGYFVRHRK